MARPYKQGIDYFPFEVDLMTDRKLRKPKEKYGYLATAVYIELLCLIYKDKGYYIDYSENSREDVQLDILDCLRGLHQPTLDIIGKVIEELVAVGLFSTELWGQNIISSHRLQCTYYKAVTDRKNVSIDWNKWLLTKEEMEGLGSSCSIYEQFINQLKNGVNHRNNEVNTPDNPQSKVNKSKVKESSCMHEAPQADSLPAVITLPLNDKTEYAIQRDKVEAWEDLYPAVDIMAELRKMRGWLEANPTRRKTRRGIMRFVNNWLSREQDGGKNSRQNPPDNSSRDAAYEALDQADAEWLQGLYQDEEGK